MATRTALRSGRLGFALLGAVLITFLALSGQARAAIGDGPALPSISSDKTDYAPGELVTLTGANWAAGESVHVVVNDDAGQTWRYENDATAADNGSFSLQFNLPDWFVAVYTVTAGGSSGTATTTFTDANVVFTSPAVTRFPGAGFQSVAKGASHDFSATVNRNGGGVDPQIIGAQTQTGNPACADPAPPTMPLSWLSVRSGAVTASSSTPIAVSGSTSIALRVSVPSGAAPGDYQGRFRLALQAGTGNANDNLNFCITVPADTTPPVITPTVTGTLGSNGWYTSDVAVSWTVTDPDSAITSQSGCNSSDVTSDTSGVTFTCTATSAGGTASSSVTVKRDATAPEVTVNLARDPDHNGWYNHGLGYRAVGSDVLSGLADCDPGAVYSGPDDENASVSLTCRDEAGNEGTGSRSFMYDSSAPTVAINLARDPDHGDWYNHGLGYRALGSDATSGVADCDPGAVYSGPDDENASVSLSCRDNAGNEGTGSRSFMFDATPPTIVATLDPPANSNGWNNTDVTVHFTCDDNLSGIDPSYGCPADQTLTSQGLHTLHVATSDVAGNVVTPSFDVRIDKTNPSISGSASPAANTNGWNNTNVVVSFSCSDALSGIAFCEPDHTLSSNGAGQSVTGDARDKADNESSATVSGINIDKLAPTVAVTGVSNGATYTLGSVPAAGCTTADQAGLSGVDTHATVSVSGPANGVGSFTATCSGATDLAGNSAAPVSVTYQVIYDWRGFFQPVDNLPALNKAKAGSAIPVKFSLGGNQGLNIFATGYPSSSQVTCGNTSAADSIELTVTAGGSSLNYDATADQYVYVWKTTSSWANSCRTLTVKLVDGTVHQANFWFVK